LKKYNVVRMKREEAIALVKELSNYSAETDWFEFKAKPFDENEAGKMICGLSNSATLHQRDAAYLIYGIHDKSHDTVGTNFDHLTHKVGNEDAISWLTDLLSPTINFTVHPFTIDGKKIVIFEIPPAVQFVSKFKDVPYIRNGSYTKPLGKYPAKEKELWRLLEREKFEKIIVKGGLTSAEVLNLLDYNAYFRNLEVARPPEVASIINSLEGDGLVTKRRGMYCITNLGALLFANKISDFESLTKKAPRLIIYSGRDKRETRLDMPGTKGYALGVNSFVSYIMGQLPAVEITRGAQKTLTPIYPEKTIRELVVNALVHQDFNIIGSGPLVEIYDDRIEITNPGTPLVAVDRIVDAQPRSRNEQLANLMRRMHFCEERGSGVDNALRECEFSKLPAPNFLREDQFTRVTIYGPRELKDMDTLERMNTVYLHTVLKYLSNESMGNESLRERLNVRKENHAQISRLIKLAQEVGLIKKKDPYSKSTKFVSYIPYWA